MWTQMLISLALTALASRVKAAPDMLATYQSGGYVKVGQTTLGAEHLSFYAKKDA